MTISHELLSYVNLRVVFAEVILIFLIWLHIVSLKLSNSSFQDTSSDVSYWLAYGPQLESCQSTVTMFPTVRQSETKKKIITLHKATILMLHSLDC